MSAEFNLADSLHRLIKQAMDSGAAKTIEEAEILFRGYRLIFEITPECASQREHQAALLTGVALARRVFLGGVTVFGPLDTKLVVPMPLGAMLDEAITNLGGRVGSGQAPLGIPIVTVGGTAQPRRSDFHVRMVYSGWRGGIVPIHHDAEPTGRKAIAPASMLAAGLAVNEAFLYVRGETNVAGRRPVGLSLWNLEPGYDWLGHGNDEPVLEFLPSRLWLLGLGHLGQSFLWALGLLPFERPSDLHLVLQDIDVVTPSTESTSILTDTNLLGKKKTRVMAEWSERRGFSTSIHERLYNRHQKRQESEPTVALCGLDNALGRRALDHSGFGLVIEAGLGRGYRDFRTIRVHTLPASRSAEQIWHDVKVDDTPIKSPAYTNLLDSKTLDRCGVTTLAGKAVGAPFVGAVAGSLVISELLRLLHGGQLMQLIDVDLQSVEHRTLVPQRLDFSSFNPGYVTNREIDSQSNAQHARRCRGIGILTDSN